MKDVQGAVTLNHYKQYIQYHIVHDTLKEVKVLILYVEANFQHTDVPMQSLDWKSLANHVGALMNTNEECQVGYGMGNNDVLPKRVREDGGAIYEQTHLSGIVGYTFG